MVSIHPCVRHLWLHKEGDDQLELEIPQFPGVILVPRPPRSGPWNGMVPMSHASGPVGLQVLSSALFNLRVVTLPCTVIYYSTRQFKMTVFQES